MATGQRRTRGAAAGQIVDFFMSATDEARTVVDFFRNATPEDAAAALAVAQTIVKQRQQSSGTNDARVRSAGAGTQRSSRRAAPPAQVESATGQGDSEQRSQRVIGNAGTPTARNRGRVIGDQSSAPQAPDNTAGGDVG